MFHVYQRAMAELARSDTYDSSSGIEMVKECSAESCVDWRVATPDVPLVIASNADRLPNQPACACASSLESSA